MSNSMAEFKCSDQEVCLRCRKVLRADAFLIEESMQYLTEDERILTLHRYHRFREELSLNNIEDKNV